MTVYFKAPNKKFDILEVENDLKSLQELVGGFIEIVYLSDKVVLICNEEGKIKGLEKNIRLGNDVICGNVIICGTKDEDFCTLSERDFINILIYGRLGAHYGEI